jgi:hypothetical protein
LQGWVLATFQGMSQKLVFYANYYMVLMKMPLTAGGSMLPTSCRDRVLNIHSEVNLTWHLIKLRINRTKSSKKAARNSGESAERSIGKRKMPITKKKKEFFNNFNPSVFISGGKK